ncbi:MAG: tRNA (5-methylaminomethyl-2-thiouridine)(34)-methyltransferase MnmD [Bacteroidota bacterium]
MSLKIIKTQDGSNSILNEELNEAYHSLNGALTESKHIFIKNGLEKYLTNNIVKRPINVFEVGIGTGLNAMLAYQYASKSGIQINYVGVEILPVTYEQVEELQYHDIEELQGLKSFSEYFHSSDWNEKFSFGNTFGFLKIREDFHDMTLESESADVVFFDAFAPNKQSEMWNYELLLKIFEALTHDGLLTTYCAQGQFKRDLKSCGFKVESLPGPPGKKEMTVAVKP